MKYIIKILLTIPALFADGLQAGVLLIDAIFSWGVEGLQGETYPTFNKLWRIPKH